MKVTGMGTRRIFCDVAYDFNTVEDAEAFAACVKSGGRPRYCAKQHKCIKTTMLGRDTELSR